MSDNKTALQQPEDTKSQEVPGKEEVYQIVGCAMEVLSILGPGFPEEPYQEALAVELQLREVPFKREVSIKIIYKDEEVGKFAADLIVNDQVAVISKTVDRIGSQERGEVFSLLRLADLKVGVILNFRKPKLEWERLEL